MTRMPSIFYCETSIGLRLTDSEDPVRRRATYAFLKWAGKRFDLRISKAVRLEVRETEDLSLRRRAKRKIEQLRPRTLTGGKKVDRIVEELLRRDVLTDRHLADLYHIGYALFGGADYLVTWDEGDVARDWTRRRVTEYCADVGRKALVIDTPIEVAKCLGTPIG